MMLTNLNSVFCLEPLIDELHLLNTKVQYVLALL